jgi:hypothetical protein
MVQDGVFVQIATAIRADTIERRYLRRRLNTVRLAQTQCTELIAKQTIASVAGVGEQHPARDVGIDKLFKQAHRDRRFRLKPKMLRDAALETPLGITRLAFRQIQPKRDRMACLRVRDRHGHQDLTVGLLAEPSAVLAGDTHRVLPFLRQPGVVDYPSLNRFHRLNGWKSIVSDRLHDRFIAP